MKPDMPLDRLHANQYRRITGYTRAGRFREGGNDASDRCAGAAPRGAAWDRGASGIAPPPTAGEPQTVVADPMKVEGMRARLVRFFTEPDRPAWPDPDRDRDPSLDDWILHGPRLR